MEIGGSMTLSDERYRALIYARDFMVDLLNPKVTPKVPKYVRQRARSVLRHYVTKYEIEMLARKSPKILQSTKGRI